MAVRTQREGGLEGGFSNRPPVLDRWAVDRDGTPCTHKQSVRKGLELEQNSNNGNKSQATADGW